MKKLLLILLCLPMIGLASFPINTFFEECDNIILKDGKEISAKILEITPKLIKYKKCDNLDGPLFSINKSDVMMIRYSNGDNETIQSPKPSGFPKWLYFIIVPLLVATLILIISWLAWELG